MTRSATAFLAFVWLGAPAVALTCEGADLYDDLPDSDRALVAEAVEDVPFAEGTFFKAVRGDTTVTVVGTLHLPDPRHATRVDAVAPAIASAERLILEATSEDETRVMALMAEEPELFYLTEGPSLIELLGEEDWARTADLLAAHGIPGIFGAKLRPWYATMMLAFPPCLTEALLSEEKGLDGLLEAVARAEGTDVVTIENPEDALRTMAGESDEDALATLRMTLNSSMNSTDMTATLIERYFDGRVAEYMALTRLLAEREMPGEGAALFDGYVAGLLEDRNANWERDLPALLGDGDSVIAVGAAHLSGDTGVLAALERLGFAIERLD